MQNKKEQFAELLYKTSYELGINPLKLLKEIAEKLNIALPNYVQYTATKDLGEILKGDIITFDRDDKELINGEVYAFILDLGESKFKTYGIYKSIDNSFIVNSENGEVGIDESIEIIGRLKYVNRY